MHLRSAGARVHLHYVTYSLEFLKLNRTVTTKRIEHI